MTSQPDHHLRAGFDPARYDPTKESENNMTTINLSDEDVFGCVWGAMASQYPWYTEFDGDDDAMRLHVVIDCEGVKESATLTPSAVRRAIEGCIEKYPNSAVAHVDWSDPECGSDVDADIADQIIQFYVLGEVVFG